MQKTLTSMTYGILLSFCDPIASAFVVLLTFLADGFIWLEKIVLNHAQLIPPKEAEKMSMLVGLHRRGYWFAYFTSWLFGLSVSIVGHS